MLNRVLIGPAPIRHLEAIWGPPLRAAGFEPILPRTTAALMTEAELREELKGCIASLAGSEPYTRAILAEAKANGMKILARCGVGYDNVDVPAATELGIPVGYGPGSNHEAVAEQTMMFVLALGKQLFWQDREMRLGHWPRQPMLSLRGRTLGIIGLGRVGKAVATRAKAFDMRLLAVEPVPDHAFIAALGIQLVDLPRLLREADWVSLHCPRRADTLNLMNAGTLAMMKPTAYLINTARGGIVDEQALAKALRDGVIAGAALDVFAREPMPADHPLATSEKVIFTAHTAGVDERSLELMSIYAAECIVDFLNGKWPGERIVNQEVRAACGC